MPPEVLIRTFGEPSPTVNISAIPDSMFNGCVPSEGSTEVISPPEHSHSTESWVAIDIIAATSFIRAVISIDEHDMYVYAVDGSYVQPQKVQVVSFTNGDRYSVLVKTDKPGAFKIRVSSTSIPQMLTGHATLSVNGDVQDDVPGSKAYIDIAGRPTSPDVVFFNETLATPFPPRHIPQSADELYILRTQQTGASYLWALNSTRLMPADFEDGTPLLFDPNFQERNNVTINTRKGTWVDLVFFLADYPMPSHPIHKHGNKMYKIGSGTGPFDWVSVDEAIKEKPQFFNLVNPPQRDTILTAAPRTEPVWTVVRYEVTNPGPWMLHCHINNHAMGGMSMVIQDGIDAWPEVPPEYQDE